MTPIEHTVRPEFSSTNSKNSSVIVELANRADLPTHLSHYAVAPVRLGLAGAAAVLSATGAKQLLRAGQVVDPLSAPLSTPRGIRRRQIGFTDFRAEWLWHDEDIDPVWPGLDGGVILYLHGGAFFIGGLNTHRRLVSRIAHASGVPALNVEYRQLPNASVVHSLSDAVTAYRYLLGRGYAPSRIILAGDSAGGGLAFRLALAIRDLRLPMPAAISAISPWGNYDCAARAAHANAGQDACLPMSGIAAVAGVGLSVDGELDPAWSPVNHNFAGLPPVLIQVGSTEVLLCDAEELACRCDEAGVPCRLQLWDRAVHVHQMMADLLPDARAAIREMAAFHRLVLTQAEHDVEPDTLAA
jgi:acetyl esterase/lipase